MKGENDSTATESTCGTRGRGRTTDWHDGRVRRTVQPVVLSVSRSYVPKPECDAPCDGQRDLTALHQIMVIYEVFFEQSLPEAPCLGRLPTPVVHELAFLWRSSNSIGARLLCPLGHQHLPGIAGERRELRQMVRIAVASKHANTVCASRAAIAAPTIARLRSRESDLKFNEP